MLSMYGVGFIIVDELLLLVPLTILTVLGLVVTVHGLDLMESPLDWSQCDA